MEIPQARMTPFFGDVMNDILQGAGVNECSVIRIMGADGLVPLLWFCRNGYQHVGYVRPGCRPAETCDVLIVRHAGDLASVTELLDRGARVRAGGVLVIQLPDGASRARLDTLLAILGRRGYRVERRVVGRRRELHLLCRNEAISAVCDGGKCGVHSSTRH